MSLSRSPHVSGSRDLGERNHKWGRGEIARAWGLPGPWRKKGARDTWINSAELSSANPIRQATDPLSESGDVMGAHRAIDLVGKPGRAPFRPARNPESVREAAKPPPLPRITQGSSPSSPSSLQAQSFAFSAFSPRSVPDGQLFFSLLLDWIYPRRHFPGSFLEKPNEPVATKDSGALDATT